MTFAVDAIFMFDLAVDAIFILYAIFMLDLAVDSIFMLDLAVPQLYVAR